MGKSFFNFLLILRDATFMGFTLIKLIMMKIGDYSTKYLLSTFTIFNCVFLWYNYPKIALADTVNNSQKCSANLEDLANSLVKDIPDYANRIIQRSRIHSHPLEFFPIYVITASKPDLQTLPLSQTQYKSLIKSTLNNDVKQIFFYHFRKTIFY